MVDQRQFQYLQAMGIPVWVQRGRQDEVVEAVAAVDAIVESEVNTTPSIDWESFENKVRVCQQCSLHQTRQCVVVGDGPRHVDVCIIGEAPGAEEDKQGKPFVGRAGQLLTEMLRAIGLDRQRVYITNILKCRPPGNRDPLPEEIAQCTPYLMQQLAWLQPKVLLLLGRVAAQTLLETDRSMRSLRNQPLSFSPLEYPVVVTYHPAYLLRTPEDKAKVLEDLLRVKKMVSRFKT